MTADLERAKGLSGGQAVWSIWPGYLGAAAPVVARHHDIPLTLVHASGHAAVADLQRLAGAIAARALFPIHAAVARAISGRFANVTTHADSEWWAV